VAMMQRSADVVIRDRRTISRRRRPATAPSAALVARGRAIPRPRR
jgi:hypothetical protein